MNRSQEYRSPHRSTVFKEEYLYLVRQTNSVEFLIKKSRSSLFHN